jgi:hypothetical protein
MDRFLLMARRKNTPLLLIVKRRTVRQLHGKKTSCEA